jgi:hypothetical protein
MHTRHNLESFNPEGHAMLDDLKKDKVLKKLIKNKKRKNSRRRNASPMGMTGNLLNSTNVSGEGSYSMRNTVYSNN